MDTANEPGTDWKAFQKIVQQLLSEDEDLQLQAAQDMGRMMEAKMPSHSGLQNSGALVRLVALLESNSTEIQAEVTTMLEAIAESSDDHIEAVVQAGALEGFIGNLCSPSLDVALNSVGALGSIAEHHDVKYCALIRELGVFHLLLGLVAEIKNPTWQQTALWALSSISNKAVLPDPYYTLPVLPILARYLESPNRGTVEDACLVLHNFTSSSNNEVIVEAIVKNNMCRQLVNIFSSDYPARLRSSALRSVGSISAGNALRTRHVIASGAIPALATLLSQPQADYFRQDTCWTTANVLTETPQNIQAIMDCNIVPLLLDALKNASTPAIKSHAYRGIANAAGGGRSDPVYMRYLVSSGCIQPLLDILATAEVCTIIYALSGINNVMKLGPVSEAPSDPERGMTFSAVIEEAGGLASIRRLLHHSDRNVQIAARIVLDEHFPDGGLASKD